MRIRSFVVEDPTNPPDEGANGVCMEYVCLCEAMAASGRGYVLGVSYSFICVNLSCPPAHWLSAIAGVCVTARDAMLA